MAILDKKVSEIYSGRDISSLSDRPNQDGMTATELKARFDQLGKEIIPKINSLIDELFSDLYSGAEQIGHTHNLDNIVDGITYKLFTAVERAKLGSIAENAEVNQNAFSNVKVGSTTIASSVKTDTFELVAGLNVSIAVDVLTKKITLSATGDLATEAVQSYIEDIGNYFTSLNVEGALQEIGANITEIKSQLAENVQRLDDNAISPEKFTGTDFQKVQQALDYALTNNVAVKFAKMYDITGNTLMINRPELYYATERKQLYLQGVGGGIKKTDSGFVFDALYANTGDINTSDLKYESVSGAGTKIWNFDKIIRTRSSNCQYRNVDTIGTALTRYTQSVYFIGEHITGGKGWKFEFFRTIDTTIKDCLVEDCEHFIRNTGVFEGQQNVKLRIVDNVIENLTGTTLSLGSTWSCQIDGNYFEQNKEYLDLKTLLATGSYHFGLTIANNHFHLSSTQTTNEVICIRLGKTNERSVGGGAISYSNASNGILYSIEFSSAASYLTSIGDVGALRGETNRIIQLSKPRTINAELQNFGLYNYFSRQYFGLMCPKGVMTTHSITLPFDFKKNYSITINSSSAFLHVTKIVALDGNSVISFTVENTSISDINLNPTVNISFFGIPSPV